jgi:hypothetical protein
MPRKKGQVGRPKSGQIDEKSLSKGQLRKLNALRKSIGDSLAEEAFAKWLRTQASGGTDNPAAQQVEAALAPLVKSGELRLPRAGVLVRAWGERLIVKTASAAE